MSALHPLTGAHLRIVQLVQPRFLIQKCKSFMCIMCINIYPLYPFYQDRETKKLARTSCWYVPGRVVRMSSALLVGPFENKQMCHSSSKHPLYFIISRICLGCLDHTPFTMTKSLQDILLVRPRTCSKDVLGHSWLNGGHSDNKQMCHSSSRHP